MEKWKDGGHHMKLRRTSYKSENHISKELTSLKDHSVEENVVHKGITFAEMKDEDCTLSRQWKEDS